MKETVLYYTPVQSPKVTKLKGVLVRMGIRIKNIQPEQVTQQIGYLAGYDGFEEQEQAGERPLLEEEILVMKDFTSRRIDELLLNLRKAGVEKIHLKAVVTESNKNWTFYQLYEEIKDEHEKMSRK